MDSSMPTVPRLKNTTLEHERLNSLINSMGDGVIAIDKDKNVAIYNGATLNILDINTAITNKSISTVLQIIDKNNQPVNVNRLIDEATVAYSSRDFRLKYPDGSTINLYLSIAPVKLGYGQHGPDGHVILIRDITREKSLEEERDEFISVISHELRTPITIAEGNISNAQILLDKGGEINTIRNSLKETHQQIVFLSEMINDLSTLSRAERDKLSVDIESINMYELITELANEYQQEAAKKGLYLKVNLHPQLELLQSGKLYVKEILQNFVTNAIKYTQQGGVIVGAMPSQNGIMTFVQDTGIGISRNDQAKVFDKFFRSEDYRTRESSGTGLGLYVTAKLAKLVHADIELKSELNKGSVFAISFPNLR
jgi:two-component system phosphate regulon sensor histidine kinase PhoR